MDIRRSFCNICRIDSSKAIFKGAAEVLRCKSCGLVYINTDMEQDFLFSHYNNDYYADWDKEKEGRKKMWEARLDDVEKYRRGTHPKDGSGRILDAGCGRGEFVEIAKGRGWASFGTEVSEYAVNCARDKGLNVYKVGAGAPTPSGAGRADFPEGFFDVITMWHVLEHVRDPVSTLFHLKKILSRNGLLVIEVPNLYYCVPIVKNFFGSLNLWSELQFDISKEVHLYHFNTWTLKKAALFTGFNILDVEVAPKLIHNATTLKKIALKLFNRAARFIYRASAINIGCSIRIYLTRR